MNKSIQPATFSSGADVARYWKELEAAGLDYHLDDDPKTIIWKQDVSVEQLDVLIQNHEKPLETMPRRQPTSGIMWS